MSRSGVRISFPAPPVDRRPSGSRRDQRLRRPIERGFRHRWLEQLDRVAGTSCPSTGAPCTRIKAPRGGPLGELDPLRSRRSRRRQDHASGWEAGRRPFVDTPGTRPHPDGGDGSQKVRRPIRGANGRVPADAKGMLPSSRDRWPQPSLPFNVTFTGCLSHELVLSPGPRPHVVRRLGCVQFPA